MKIELDTDNPNFHKIISYSENSFQLNDKVVHSNIVISGDRLVENWIDDDQILATQHLDEIIAWHPEIIILGTGKALRFPEPKLISYVTSKNIGFEVMDTGAACRSYNLLVAEGRNVVACLYLLRD